MMSSLSSTTHVVSSWPILLRPPSKFSSRRRPLGRGAGLADFEVLVRGGAVGVAGGAGVVPLAHLVRVAAARGGALGDQALQRERAADSALLGDRGVGLFSQLGRLGEGAYV